MSLLTRLFSRPVRRHYALLDEQQRCRMLLTATERPNGERWVEIGEASLGMLGQPLAHAPRPDLTPNAE